jgi:hypothetical protein
VGNFNIDQYRLLSAPELDKCKLPTGMRILGAYLSEIAFVVWFELSATAEHVQELREQVAVVIRTLNDRLRRYGVDCPAIVVVHPAPTDTPDATQHSAEFRTVYRQTAADQDWHRGEFLVFVEASNGEAEKRIKDLLDPDPPGKEIVASARTLEEIVEKLKNAKEDNLLLDQIVGTWRDRVQPADQLVTAGQFNAGVDTIRRYLAPLKNEVSRLLKDVD